LEGKKNFFFSFFIAAGEAADQAGTGWACRAHRTAGEHLGACRAMAGQAAGRDNLEGLRPDGSSKFVKKKN